MPRRTTRTRRSRIRRLFDAYLAVPLLLAAFAATLMLLVSGGMALGFRREFWLHHYSLQDFWSSAPTLSGLVFTVTFIVTLILRPRL